MSTQIDSNQAAQVTNQLVKTIADSLPSEPADPRDRHGGYVCFITPEDGEWVVKPRSGKTTLWESGTTNIWDDGPDVVKVRVSHSDSVDTILNRIQMAINIHNGGEI